MLRRWLVLVVFSIWFGGFTFYSAIVVPIGNDVLESDILQGLVTQRVTTWLNSFGAGVALLLAIDLWLTRRAASRRLVGAATTTLAILAASLPVLALLHAELDQLIRPERLGISDPDRFGTLHVVYLQVSTVQWLAGAIHIGLLIALWRREIQSERGSRPMSRAEEIS